MTTVVRVQVPSLAPPVFSGDCSRYARVVELADSLDSGSSVHYARAGSSPASRTKKKDTTYVVSFFLILLSGGRFYRVMIAITQAK